MIFIKRIKNGKGKVTQIGVIRPTLKSLKQLPKMPKKSILNPGWNLVFNSARIRDLKISLLIKLFNAAQIKYNWLINGLGFV